MSEFLILTPLEQLEKTVENLTGKVDELEHRISQLGETLQTSITKLATEIGKNKGELQSHVTTPDAHNPFGFAE